MESIFNYSTFKTRLDKKTRTLFVTLNRGEDQNSITLELLFELESLFSWVTSRVEIHSIFIESDSDEFSSGLDEALLPKMNNKQLAKITDKLQSLTQSFFHLPQTVVIDLQKGVSNIASELAIGADIRICDVHSKVKFDHTRIGLIPCSGGMGILSSLINPAVAKNWILSGRDINRSSLTDSGFVYKMYDTKSRNDIVNEVLEDIHAQAPVQRIQTKLGLFEVIKESVEKSQKFEKQIARAARISEDWKEKDQEFMPAKSMQYSTRLTLVKDEDDGPGDESPLRN